MKATTKRERIYNKFGGLCAYSGTPPLKDDWQIDHMIPRSLMRVNDREELGGYINGEWVKLDSYNDENNLAPCQRIINHYKRAMEPHTFKEWRLSTLHERLKKLPKNPRVERSIRHKEYLLEVASYFDITPDKPFDGKFYYEKLKANEK